MFSTAISEAAESSLLEEGTKRDSGDCNMNITLAFKAIKTSLLERYYKFFSCELKAHISGQT